MKDGTTCSASSAAWRKRRTARWKTRAEIKDTIGEWRDAVGELRGAVSGLTQSVRALAAQVRALDAEKSGQRLDAIELKARHYDRMLDRAGTFVWRVLLYLALAAVAGGTAAKLIGTF